jgi:protein involved in polysaccharide export with SLBB domain
VTGVTSSAALGSLSGTRAELPRSGSPPSSASRLEGLYAGAESRVSRKLVQFGYAAVSQATPLERAGLVPASYEVGPGDEISITVGGSFHAQHLLEIDREGRVKIPEIGLVQVAGTEVRGLSALIRAAYAKTRRDFDVSVTLGKLRRIEVYVLGHVGNPGRHEVPAGLDVLGAVAAAGGVLKSGTLRRIALTVEEREESVDLYPSLCGDSGAAGRVRSGGPVVSEGARIYVPEVGGTVALAGQVKYPAIYELGAQATSLGALLDLGGGLTPFARTSSVTVERTVLGVRREPEEVSLDGPGLERPVADGELVLVGGVDGGMQAIVKVDGHVVRPGDYPYRAGMKASDLLRLAGGLRVGAHAKEVFLSRVVDGGDRAFGVPRASRRVLVFDADRVLAGEASGDIGLNPLDHVRVRSEGDMGYRRSVEILGAVRQPGVYELTRDLRASDLLALAGGSRANAYLENAELLRRVSADSAAEMAVRRYRVDLGRALSDRGGKRDPSLRDGDQLVVRTLEDRRIRAHVSGEVRFPGLYVFPPDARITDLLAAAGGLRPQADLRAASFVRESVRSLQRERFRHLVERSQQLHELAFADLIQSGHGGEAAAGKASLQQNADGLRRMERQELNGRVVIPFLEDDFPSSPFNLVLENNDRLTIPKIQETVSVVGHVFTPTTQVCVPGLTVEDALERSGGLTELGDPDQIYVVRASGEVQSLAQSLGLDLSESLLPGDVVLVPRAPREQSVESEIFTALSLLRNAAEISALAASTPTGGLTSVSSVPSHEDGLDLNRLLEGPDSK